MNIDITAPECLAAGFTYEMKWYGTMALPLAAGLILFLCWAYKILRKMATRRGRQPLNRHWPRILATYTMLFYCLYLSLTKRALDVFNCNPPKYPDGHTYASFTSQECGGNCRCGEGLQKSLQWPAAITFCVYALGYPAAVAWVLFWNRKKIKVDQLLRAAELGDERETNPYAYDIRKKYHKLYYHFKPGKHYWILLVILRKFLVAFGVLMFRSNPTFQMAFILMVLFGAFVMQVKHKPFMSSSQRAEVLKDHQAKVESGERHDHEALDQYLQEARRAARGLRSKDKSRRKIKMGGSMSGVAALKASNGRWRDARVFFWDYNTVELVLLGCSILVCVAGIMFESGHLSDKPGSDKRYEREVITWWIVTVIALSFVYYLMVFASEVCGTSPWVMRLFASSEYRNQQQAEKDHILEEEAGMQFEAVNPLNKSFKGKKAGMSRAEKAKMRKLELDAARQREINARLVKNRATEKKIELTTLAKHAASGKQKIDGKHAKSGRKEFRPREVGEGGATTPVGGGARKTPGGGGGAGVSFGPGV